MAGASVYETGFKGRSSSLGEGAAQAAPTAPHATPRRGKGRRNGPERFWARWPVRVALGLSLVLSGLAHSSLVPLDFSSSVEVNDYSGEAAIPVDLLEQGGPAAETPPPPPAAESTAPDEKGSKEPNPIAIRAPLDAGRPRTVAIREAGADGPADAEVAEPEAPSGAVSQSTDASDGDAGQGRDPQALLASSGAVQADVIYVTLLVNTTEIRKSPLAARMGALMHAVWGFMHGTESLFDPVRDVDWYLITGPALRDTSADALTVHYSAPEARADRVIAIVTSHSPRGGAYDAGVPGVRAWLVYAEHAERVILRPRPRVGVVVPPRRAHAIALQLAHMKEPPTNILPGVATYLRVLEPHHALPAVVPEEVDDLVVKVYPLPDGGARTEVVGRCKDEARAARAADKLRRALSDLLGSFTGAGINFITRGLLNGVDVDSDQNEVRVHLKASEDQLDALLSYVEGQLGIYENGPAPSGGTPPAPR